MTDTEVLGIDVNRTLLRRWAGWLAPVCQPFFLTATEAAELGLAPDPARELSPELRDTYEVWNVAKGLEEAVLPRYVSEDQLPCRRRSVPEEVWRAAAAVLPRARTLSGTFAGGSRGNSADTGATNCFATVMAAAGVRNAADEPFEAWLTSRCTAGGGDNLPGTVLVWRDADGAATHAAVTLGGWALHKPGQEWLSPRQVLTVDDIIRLAPPGLSLHRHSLR